MKLSTPALILGGLIATPQLVLALGQNDAETMFDAFNNVFLTTSGSDVFYKAALNDTTPDIQWTGSLDILAAQDAYERTGDPDKKTLVNNLLTTWLASDRNAPPWSWDGYNDDIGWFTLALIRGYQMTGNSAFLDQAKYGFDYAYGRGWDTQYNGGGIWEEQPDDAARETPPHTPEKEALSTDSLGKVACMIYQSTNDQSYLAKCQQIYTWVRNNIYNSATGQINNGIYENGDLNTAKAAYSQGTFLDFANLVYLITGDGDVYDDAKRAIDFGRNSLTENGIFSNGGGGTWADEMARGVGHFVRDNKLWDTYYTWMVQNADSILANRRTDLGITWNAWDQLTSNDNTIKINPFVSAVAWLQLTPATKPDARGGFHIIVNNQTGLAVDSGGVFGNGKNVIQWSQSDDLNQRWLFTPNSDLSWNIINLSTWQSLDCPSGNPEANLAMIQWQPTRDSNQRWWVDVQSDGTYKIWNQASGMALDGASSTTNGASLIQYGWNGGPQQRWILQ